MPNQEQSRDGTPRKDKDRPSPDVNDAPDGQAARGGQTLSGGQASVRGTGDPGSAQRADRPMAGEEKGQALTATPGSQDYRGDGPAKIGLTSDNQPDLVAPSGVNDRDPNRAGDAPVAGDTLDFDDGTDELHPRGRTTGQGRTWDEKFPSDAGDLGAPKAGMSERNGPSDPDAKRNR